MARLAGYIKALVRQVTDSGSKLKPEQVAKGKDMISEACRVGIVFLDSQIGFVIKQAIKNMRRIPYCRIDDLGMKGRILVRNVSHLRALTVDSTRPTQIKASPETDKNASADARLWDDPFLVFPDSSGYGYQLL